MSDKSNFSKLVGKGLYPPSWAWMLLLPLRNFYLSPKKLAQRLELKPDWEVLELGSGPGYFSPYIAKQLSSGNLYLVDVQEEMLNKASKRLKKNKITNAFTKLTDGEKLDFPDNKFDLIYLITVLGEIEKPNQILAEIKRVSKPNVILSITEQAGDPDALSLEQVSEVLKPFGFLLEKVFGKGKTYTANFRKM